MRTNVAAASEPVKTHEGGRGERHVKPEALLERTTATCMLFENTFYETGDSIAERVRKLVEQIVAKDPAAGTAAVAALAVRARTEFKLRHVPLWLARCLTRVSKGRAVGDMIRDVIRRPDEMSELLALYWKGQPADKRETLSKQVKRGLASAFQKFSAYQIAKWNRDSEVKLKDVLFLVHAKPKDEAQAALWKSLVDDTLAAPDTWEVALSAGKDKKGTWERLIREEKLGYIALLMNLRNMVDAHVDLDLVAGAIRSRAKGSWALPFRFVAAADAAPALAPALSDGLMSAMEDVKKLDGKTALLVDVSPSMKDPLSSKSVLNRYKAAAALAALCVETIKSCRLFAYSTQCAEVPAYRGLAIVEKLWHAVRNDGTYTWGAVKQVLDAGTWDRVIVITDEQSHDDPVPLPKGTKGYVINVGPYAPGMDVSGGWTRINGFSERILDWVRYEETGSLATPEEVAD